MASDPAFETVSCSEASQVIRAYSGSQAMLDELIRFSERSTVTIHRGPLQKTKLAVGADIILVAGDLHVEGILEDCEKVDTSLLIVLGNVQCESLISLSAIHILGHLEATNAVLGDSLCDYGLYVGGNLKTPTILEYGHYIEVKGEIHSQDIYSFHMVVDKFGRKFTNLQPEEMNSEILKPTTTQTTHLPSTVKFIKRGGRVFRRSKS